MRLFASLALLAPLVVSVVAAPVKTQPFEVLFDDIGTITLQLSHTSVAAVSINHDTFPVSGSIAHPSTSSVLFRTSSLPSER